jgi:Holliday junction resolvase
MSKQRDKGRRFENEVANKLTEAGIPSERVPLSGSFGGKYDSDVVIGTCDSPIDKIECKNRENISKLIWEWLEGNDYLALRRNNYPALVVMTLDRFIEDRKDD